MKKLMIMLGAAAFSFGAFAQEDKTGQQPEQAANYCAKKKDGKIVLMSGQNEITEDVTLADGSTIKPEKAIVEKTDGSTLRLKEGECVDASGNKVKSKTEGKEKMKKEEERPPQRY